MADRVSGRARILAPHTERTGPRATIHITHSGDGGGDGGDGGGTPLQASVEKLGPTSIRLRWSGPSQVTIEHRESDDSYEAIYTGPGGRLPSGEFFADVHELDRGIEHFFRVTG